jgi:ribosomal protein S18 acetylase RimI-like enzyme
VRNRLVIRDAGPDEADQVAGILKASYKQYEQFMPPDAWQSYLADILDVRGRMSDSQQIVAEMDGRIVGAVTLYIKKRHLPEMNWPAGWAGGRLLGVDPAYRGKHIGHALMDECIRRCRAAGVKTIGLHTAPVMEVAKGMYERMGFQRVPEFDHHPRADVTIMAYKLDI